MKRSFALLVVIVVAAVMSNHFTTAHESAYDQSTQTSQNTPPAPERQGRKYALTLKIQGTEKDDTFIVNDMDGVIITSPGMRVGVVGEGALKGPTTLDAPDARGPGSGKGFLLWSFDGSGNNYYTGEFGDGADRYIRIDGPAMTGTNMMPGQAVT